MRRLSPVCAARTPLLSPPKSPGRTRGKPLARAVPMGAPAQSETMAFLDAIACGEPQDDDGVTAANEPTARSEEDNTKRMKELLRSPPSCPAGHPRRSPTTSCCTAVNTSWSSTLAHLRFHLIPIGRSDEF